jgi:hypothetical protein
MNHKPHVALFLTATLFPLAAGEIAAQPPRRAPAGARPSHRPLNTDLPDASPEDLLRQRLQHARALGGSHTGDGLSPELKEKILEMLQDRELLERFQRSIPKEDLDRLGEKLRRGQSLTGDRALGDLIRKGAPDAKLSGPDAEALKEWAKNRGGATREEDKAGAGREAAPPRPNPSRGRPSPARPGTPTVQPRPQPSAWQRWQGRAGRWTENNLDSAIRRLDGKFDGEVGKDWRDALGRAARGAAGKVPDSDLGSRAGKVSRYLPRLGDRLPRNLSERVLEGATDALRRSPRHSGPLLGRVNTPAAPAAPGHGAGFVLLLLAAVLIAMLAWRGRAWYARRRDAAGRWKLGPWPVRPGEVATRDDLVRAFEHLALLCLGPAARTCNHLELATRLADRPSTDPDGQRDAAGHLATLYERARYSPGEEPLTRDDLAAARRELCFLAGVAA